MRQVDEHDSRSHAVANSIGTHVMEDLAPDHETRVILDRYKRGELSLEEFSAAMDAYALKLTHSSVAGAAR